MQYKSKCIAVIPPHVPRNLLRQYLRNRALNEAVGFVGGILPMSFIARREKQGRPIKGKFYLGSLSYRPIDIIAAAKADLLEISECSPKEVPRLLLDSDIERLTTIRDSLMSQIDVLQEEIKNHRSIAHEFIDISVMTSDRRMLAHDEIVSNAFSPQRLCGIYFLIANERVVYVGQSVNIQSRIQSHRASKIFDSVAAIQVDESQLDFIESLYIHALSPKMNVGVDGKLYAPFSIAQLAEFMSEKTARNNNRKQPRYSINSDVNT